MILKYILVWFVLAIVANINGIFRNAVYGNYVGELRAHQISTVIGIILFGLVIWGFSHLWKITSTQQAWIIGFMWLGMTMAFEFLFGHFVIGHAWSKLLHDYNILAGRIWLLVLIWTTVAPYVFYKLSIK